MVLRIPLSLLLKIFTLSEIFNNVFTEFAHTDYIHINIEKRFTMATPPDLLEVSLNLLQFSQVVQDPQHLATF